MQMLHHMDAAHVHDGEILGDGEGPQFAGGLKVAHGRRRAGDDHPLASPQFALDRLAAHLPGEAVAEDAVHIALQHGRHRCPPDREQEGDRVGVLNELLLPRYVLGQGRLAAHLLRRQHRVEAHGVEIAHGDFVPALLQFIHIGARRLPGEAAGTRMGENDEVFHGLTSSV